MNCLNQAIAEERIHQVRLLLSMNVDPESRDKNDANRTPLLKASRLACEESAKKIMKILLNAGVDINSTDNLRKTSLHHACVNGKSQIVHLLLKDDSLKLNEQDKDGRTPLMLAAINGHYRIARMLILKLARFDLDIDLRDSQGYTALLLAIKNRNYSIACDLVRNGNSCSTIRDNEEFKNASDWLKKTIGETEIGKSTLANKRLRKEHSRSKANPDRFQISDDATENQSRILSAIPVLTVSSIPDSTDQDTEESVADISISGMVTAMKQAAANSGLLFEPDPYKSHSRPPSSVLSKISLTSSKNISSHQVDPIIPASISEHSEQQSNAKASIHVESKNYQETLPLSTKKIANELESTTGRSLFSASSINQQRRLSQISKPIRGKLASARKPAINALKVDLGDINVSPSEYSYSHSNAEINLQMSAIKDIPAKDLSSTNLVVIQTLRQALKDQKKIRITRSSTSFSHSYAVVSEEKKSNALERPNTTTQSRVASQKRDNAKKMVFNEPSNASIRSFLTQSNVSEDHFTNNYLQPSSIERAKRNIQTLFSLYTDSLLWAPTPIKSTSLSVQGGRNGSDKLTLASDLTNSVSDLASIIEQAGSVGPNEDAGNNQSTGKAPVPPKSRAINGSATSRVSKKSARISSSRNSSAYK